MGPQQVAMPNLWLSGENAVHEQSERRLNREDCPKRLCSARVVKAVGTEDDFRLVGSWRDFEVVVRDPRHFVARSSVLVVESGDDHAGAGSAWDFDALCCKISQFSMPTELLR